MQKSDLFVSIALRTGHSKTAVLRTMSSKYCVDTLARYVDDGGKYCLLAGAGKCCLFQRSFLLITLQGSVYLLAIVAAAGLRRKIRTITMDIYVRLHALFRKPSSSEQYICDTELVG